MGSNATGHLWFGTEGDELCTMFIDVDNVEDQWDADFLWDISGDKDCPIDVVFLDYQCYALCVRGFSWMNYQVSEKLPNILAPPSEIQNAEAYQFCKENNLHWYKPGGNGSEVGWYLGSSYG